MRSRHSKEVIPVLQETGRSLSVVLVPLRGSLDGSLTNFKGRIRVKVDFSRPGINVRRLTVSPSKSELFPIFATIDWVGRDHFLQNRSHLSLNWLAEKRRKTDLQNETTCQKYFSLPPEESWRASLKLTLPFISSFQFVTSPSVPPNQWDQGVRKKSYQFCKKLEGLCLSSFYYSKGVWTEVLQTSKE